MNIIYANPGQAGAKVDFKAKYDNFIGGKWVPPVDGEYFDVITPVTGKGLLFPPRNRLKVGFHGASVVRLTRVR